MTNNTKTGRRWLLIPALLLAVAVGWLIHYYATYYDPLPFSKVAGFGPEEVIQVQLSSQAVQNSSLSLTEEEAGRVLAALDGLSYQRSGRVSSLQNCRYDLCIFTSHTDPDGHIHLMISPEYLTVSTGKQEMARYTCDDIHALLACLGSFYPA